MADRLPDIFAFVIDHFDAPSLYGDPGSPRFWRVAGHIVVDHSMFQCVFRPTFLQKRLVEFGRFDSSRFAVDPAEDGVFYVLLFPSEGTLFGVSSRTRDCLHCVDVLYSVVVFVVLDSDMDMADCDSFPLEPTHALHPQDRVEVAGETFVLCVPVSMKSDRASASSRTRSNWPERFAEVNSAGTAIDYSSEGAG